MLSGNKESWLEAHAELKAKREVQRAEEERKREAEEEARLAAARAAKERKRVAEERRKKAAEEERKRKEAREKAKREAEDRARAQVSVVKLSTCCRTQKAERWGLSRYAHERRPRGRLKRRPEPK